MSNPHVLLKADRRVEGDEADDKADPLVCIQLNPISVLQYFFLMAGSIDHQHVLKQDFFLLGVLATVVALFWKTG